MKTFGVRMVRGSDKTVEAEAMRVMPCGALAFGDVDLGDQLAVVVAFAPGEWLAAEELETDEPVRPKAPRKTPKAGRKK